MPGVIVARNVLDRAEVKYFVANQACGPQNVSLDMDVVANLAPGPRSPSLEWLLHVAFARGPIERCFEQAKDELGMDPFEVRGWRAIHRHL